MTVHLHPIVSVAILVAVGVAAAAVTLASRRIKPGLAKVDTNPWSSTLSYIATAFGVIVGFSILFLFGTFADARHSVGDEATSVGTAFEEMKAFGEDGIPVQQALICYARAVVAYDWPAMEDRGSAPEVDNAYTEIILALSDVQHPVNSTFKPAIATNVLLQVGNVSTARESRLVAAEARLPVMLWALLWGGGILVVVLVFAVTVPAPARVQAILVGLATMFTMVMMLLVVALNNPFASGSGRVSPRLIEQTAASMEHELPAASLPSCVPSGS